MLWHLGELQARNIIEPYTFACYVTKLLCILFIAQVETGQEEVQEDVDKTMSCDGNLKEEISVDNMNATLNDT